MSAFPQVRPYGTGPRARFPYGVRPVTGTLEEQLQASLDAIERAKLIDEMTRLSNRLASYAGRHAEASSALDMLDGACDALREAA